MSGKQQITGRCVLGECGMGQYNPINLISYYAMCFSRQDAYPCEVLNLGNEGCGSFFQGAVH